MPNKISSSNKSKMRVRIITSIVMMAVIFPCFILGGFFYFFLMIFISQVATHELLMVKQDKKMPLYVQIITHVYTLLFYLIMFIIMWSKGLDPFNLSLTNYNLNTILLILYPIGLFMVYFFTMYTIAIFDDRISTSDVNFLVLIETFVVAGFLGLSFLRYFPAASGIKNNPTYFASYYQSNNIPQRWQSCILVFTILFGTWSSDIGAYFFGLYFGKHHMNERVSPNKTWEGFIGGCLSSYIVYFAMISLYEFAFKTPLVPGLLQLQISPLLKEMHVIGGHSWLFVTLIGVLLPIVGNIGGFLFSLIKRHYNIKDYGKILPGHGGIIDRFDAVITNSVLTSLLILLMAF